MNVVVLGIKLESAGVSQLRNQSPVQGGRRPCCHAVGVLRGEKGWQQLLTQTDWQRVWALAYSTGLLSTLVTSLIVNE